MLTSTVQVPEITIGAGLLLMREDTPPVTVARRSLRTAARKTLVTVGRALDTAVKKTLGMIVKRALDMVVRRALDTVVRRALDTVVKKVVMVVDVDRRRASVTTGCLEALETKRRSLATAAAGRSMAQVAVTTEETVMTEGTRPALFVLGYRVP